MAKPKSDSPAVLLVEGNNDFHVMMALFVKYNVPQVFDVIDCEGIDKLKRGKENLIEGIGVRLKGSNLKKLGIVVDADTNIGAQWQSLSDILKKGGFNLPEKIPAEGLIAEVPDKKIGIWIMPDNQMDGMLEDFIRFLIPEEDVLVPIAEKTLTGIEESGHNRYNKKLHRSKAFIHTWLAWQEDPGTPMGLAITKKYLTTENREIVERFIRWITRLFVE
jgi:hypothetical protein